MHHQKTRLISILTVACGILIGTSAAGAAEKSMVEKWLDGDLPYAGPQLTYDGKPIKVRYSTFLGAGGPLMSVTERAVKRLKEETNGKIDVTIFYANSLADAQKGAFEAVSAGVADVSTCYSFINPGGFDLQLGLQMPYLFDRVTVGSHAILQLYPKYFKENYEAKGVLLARSTVTPPGHILTRNKPVKKLEDMRGRKVGGNIQPDVIRALGAAPVSVTVPEYYSSFQTGVVDTMSMHDTGYLIFRLLELVKYRTLASLNSVPIEYCMNERFFRDLPDDIREIFHLWLMRFNHAEAQVYFDKVAEEGRKAAAAAGIPTYVLPQKEFARWVLAIAPVLDEWENEMASKGRPGREMLEELRAKVAELDELSNDELFSKIYTSVYPGLVD